jgi:hypothetical protein
VTAAVPPPADTAPECCDCICEHQCTKDPTVTGHQGCVACKWCSCGEHAAAPELPPTSAAVERALKLQAGSVLAREVLRLRPIEERARSRSESFVLARDGRIAHWILTGETRRA